MRREEVIKMTPRSEASKKAQYKYNSAHLKRIPLDVKLEKYDEIKAAAAAAGETINGYIKEIAAAPKAQTISAANNRRYGL